MKSVLSREKDKWLMCLAALCQPSGLWSRQPEEVVKVGIQGYLANFQTGDCEFQRLTRFSSISAEEGTASCTAEVQCRR